MSDNALDVYDEITGGERGTGSFTFVYNEQPIDWDVTPLPKPQKNDLLSQLPDGYFDPVLDLDAVDVDEDELDEMDEDELDEMDEDEVMSLLKEQGVDLAEATRSMLLDETGTETAIDAIVDSFEHASLSDKKTENIIRSSNFPDRAFEEALRTVLEVSQADEDVVEFRSER